MCTPKTPLVKLIQISLSFLEVEMTEFRENKQQVRDTVQTLKEELRHFQEESRASLEQLRHKLRHNTDQMPQSNDVLQEDLCELTVELQPRERDMMPSVSSI